MTHRAPDRPLRDHLEVLLIVGGLSAFAPLSSDLYLAGLPQLATDLGATTSQAQLTLTASLAGLALGQLVVGPASDRLGRRGPLLAGLALYTVVSVLCAVATDIWVFTALRLLQGLGGAAGIVISRAVIRDHFWGSALVRAFALAMLVNGLAPILAPTLGALLLPSVGWRGLFLVLAGIGGALLAISAFRLPESLPPERRRHGGLATVGRAYAGLLRDRAFMGYVMSAALAFAAMFAYIGSSPFIVQELYGQTPGTFALIFGVNACGLMVAAQTSGLLVGRFGARRLMRTGLVTASLGGVVLVASALAGTGLWPVLAGFFLVVASYGLVAPNATALAMADQPHQAGSASALMGSIQFLTGALAAPLAGLGGVGSALPAAVVIAGCAWAALAVSLTLGRPRRSAAVPADVVSPGAGPGPAP
ncbi:MAG: multidrug effflux MFS transporter [Chloroflexota bacterium]